MINDFSRHDLDGETTRCRDAGKFFRQPDIVMVGEGDGFGVSRVGEQGEEALAGAEMNAGMRGLDAAAGAEAGDVMFIDPNTLSG